MTAISNQVCEAVSECVKLAAQVERPFWDLKSILAALGISVSLGWNVVQFVSGRRRRKRDQQWEMFKDEVYSPFHELLIGFEQQIRPAQLAVRLSSMGSNELLGAIGEYHATVSEIELFCGRADKHDYTSHSVFSKKFKECSEELDLCIGKMLNPATQDPSKFESVSDAYRKLIDQIRTCLSKCRKGLH